MSYERFINTDVTFFCSALGVWARVQYDGKYWTCTTLPGPPK